MHRTITILLTFAAALASSWLALGAPVAAQVGELDPTFDGDGIRLDDFDTVDRAWQPALQPDGRILVFGYSETNGDPNSRVGRLTRYHPDGSLDESWTYAAAGCGPTPREFRVGTVEPDGPILAVGYRQWGCGGQDRDIEVIRIDSTTGSILDEGERPAFQGFADGAHDLVLLDDGKVVVAGWSYGDSSATAGSRDGALARFADDLTLDPTFGTDGEVLIDVNGEGEFLFAVVAQADGKIVAVGFTVDGGQSDFLLVRLDIDGTLDTTFDGDGIVTTDFFGFDDIARRVAIQPDGKIVVAGSRSNASDVLGFTIVRYDTDGSLDASFGTGGVVVVDFAGLPAAANDLAIQGDGKIVVAGWTETGAGGPESRDFAVVRLDASGALDPSFSGDGGLTLDLDAGKEDIGLGIVLQPFDGDVVVAGIAVESINDVRHEDMAVVRLVGDSCSLDAVVNLDPQDVGTTATFQACDELHAGTGGFRVLGSGDVTFRAGSRIGLEDGFEVQSGGGFRAVIE